MKEYTDAELAQILDKDIFHMISAAADELQLDCYVVGGYVRDIFLESQSDDIDCVVVGSGIAVAKRLKEKLGRRAHLSVFKNFGTAQVKYYPEGVRIMPSHKSSSPLNGSTNSPKRSLLRHIAMALMVKSRRFWSSSNVPSSTIGLRESR